MFSPLLAQNEIAPAFSLLDQTGRTNSLEQALEGSKGLILLFFSSHFLPGDLNLLKAYAEAYSRLKAAGLEVLAISGLNWETLHHLSKRLDLPYKVLFDPCCRISTRYGAMLIPKFVTGRAVYWIELSLRIHQAGLLTPQELLNQG